MADQAVIEAMKAHALFKGFTEDELAQLSPALRLKDIPAGEVILSEGMVGDGLYLVHEGTVEVSRHMPGLDEERPLVLLEKGDLFGEGHIFAGGTVSATVRARTQARVLFASDEALAELWKLEAGPMARLIMRLAQSLSQKLNATTELTVHAVEQALEHSRARVGMARLMTSLAVTMATYGLLLKMLSGMAEGVWGTLAVSGPLIALLALATWKLAQSQGISLKECGVTTENATSHLIQAFFMSLPFIVGLTLFKALVVAGAPGEGMSLFVPLSELTPARLLALLVYVALCPLQEFIARGALQTSIARLLPRSSNALWAVVASNAVFAFAHLHLSTSYALAIFFPGLFWGTMFHHQRSLVGVAASHALLGGWALFALGFGPLIRSLP